MTLGDIVKRYRSDNHLSMDDFARLSGLSKGYISMLERNENPISKKPIVPSLTTIKGVAQALGKTPEEVMRMLGPDQTIDLTDDYRVKDHPNLSSDFAEMFDRLSDMEKYIVIRQIRGLLSGK